MKQIIRLTVIAAVFLTCGMAAADTDRTVEREFKVKEGGRLFLDTDMGSVRITSHTNDVVQVNVLMRADTGNSARAEDIFDEFGVEMNQSGKDVVIKGKYRNRKRWWDNDLRVRYQVAVPRNYNLEIRTSGGGIEVDDIDGSVEVSTSGGGISIGRVEGDVRAKTSGGGIEVEGVTGDVEVNTSGGPLQLKNIDGNLRGRTSGGSIKAQLLSQIDEDVELSTSGGSIRLSVPDGLNADLQASTSGGHISTDLPLSITGKISDSSISGRLNEGGPNLRLKTSGGSIHIQAN